MTNYQQQLDHNTRAKKRVDDLSKRFLNSKQLTVLAKVALNPNNIEQIIKKALDDAFDAGVLYNKNMKALENEEATIEEIIALKVEL